MLDLFWLCLSVLIIQVVVPRFAVGIIIGRNGEMIKKIQNDAGVRIQFKQGTEMKQDRMMAINQSKIV